MSHSPPGYMDGVPVKISEKYKPPRRVTLPQNLFQRVSYSSETVALAHYDFSLENSVITKISEWRVAKEKDVVERKERIRLLEEARRNRAEELEAAENEERRKQLTEVSYPSTDDLSEISSEGDNPNSETPPECPQPVCDPSPPSNTSYQTNSQSYQHGNVSILAYQSNKVLNRTTNVNTNFITEHSNPATNILTPMISQAANITAFDDYATAKADQNNKYDLKNYEMQDSNHTILNKINYSDFENDTSSPFDNMELKTINDLELLAQVLSNTQITHSHTENNDDSNNSSSQAEQKTTQFYNTNNSAVYNDVLPSHSKYNNVQYNNSNTYYSNKLNSYSMTSTPCIQTSSAYSTVSNNVGDCKTSSIGINGYYAPGYDYNYTTNQQTFQNYTPTAQVTEYKAPANPIYTNSQNPSFYNVNDKVYNYQSFQYSGNIPNTSQTPISRPLTPSSSVTQKSKSRSVPDIVKELQDEVTLVKDNEAKRSQNSSPAPVNVVCPEFSRSNKQVRNKSASDGRSKPQEILLDPYKLLPLRTQRMANHISQMGFPLPRVSRACQVIGENDKKVIEHLLLMDQLMDLGFPESRVSEALLKFNNNRDQALEYLIS